MQKEKKSFFVKFLDIVEKGGNKLPHPVTLFVYLIIAIAIASGILAALEVSVEYTAINRSTMVVEEMTAEVIPLFSADGIRYIFETAVTNFTGFAPLGTVLVALLGVGVADGSGLIGTALKKVVLVTPKWLITAMLVFTGIMSNVASDAGYVILVPLGAVVFLSFGRHPLAGMAAAFAGVSGGFSANLLIGTIDPLLGGFTTEAAKIMDPTYEVTAVANFFFMFASTFLITALGWYVTEKIVEPRLGEYKGTAKSELQGITDDEKRGLKWSGIATSLFILVMLFLTIPENAILRNVENGSIIDHSPFINGIVFIIGLFFFVAGVAYGFGAKTMKSDKDVIKSMSDAMASMGGYLVLAFVAAQFIAYFNYTNLGTVISVGGANVLESIGFTSILPLLIVFILITAFLNLFMGSASAKWAIMAPIFVPMLMQMGVSPEATQLAYRIGDSTTNIISPLMSYFAVIIAFAQKYDEDTGIGTVISLMLPYSLIFLAGWTALLIIWFLLGLPIGPNIGIEYVLPM